MATNVSSKLLPTKNVIYDSVNDTTSGRKRAVQTGGGVSVAERARLFGTQVTHSSAINNSKPIQSNVVRQERNYQPMKPDIDRRPQQNPSYSTSQRAVNHHRSPTRTNKKPHREELSPTDLRDYSTLIRTHKHHHHSSNHQRPATTLYDNPRKANHTHTKPSNYEYYDRQERLPRNNSYQPSNYFRPIQDPLQVLFDNSTQIYTQQQRPATTIPNMNGMQPFNLGNLISSIQQDYMNNITPYVSSVQFVGNDQSLADIGFLTPAATRKDYVRRPNNPYHRLVPSDQYDVFDTNNVYRYDKPHSKRSYQNNQYSSMQRRRHRPRYHNQASSPIHILESSHKVNTHSQRQDPPATDTPKAPIPVAANLSEEENEATITQNEAATSEESSESEDEVPVKPVNEPAPAPAPAPVTTAARPPLPLKAPLKPAQPSETEDSDSDESESESETESEEEDEKPKPKPKPSPFAQPKPSPVAQPKPSPVAKPNISRSTPVTPQTNARVVPLRIVPLSDTAIDPPESSKSVKSFDLETSRKSSSFGSKLKSIGNKFRRKKSSE